MKSFAHTLYWFVLLPLRLIILAFSILGLTALYIVGLGRTYLSTIIRNIISDCLSLSMFNLDEERKKHMHLLGATGSGKSSAIEFFINENIRKGQGFLLIEPHGELVGRVIANKQLLKVFPKLVFLNFDQHPPAFNLFALPLPDKNQQQFINGLASDITSAFATNMQPSMTEAQFIMLRNLFIAGFYIKKANFLDILDLLSDNPVEKLKTLLPNLPTPPLQNYFQQDFLAGDASKTRKTLRGRLNSFVIPKQMYESLRAKACDIDFHSILAEGKYVVVKATTTTLGTFEAVTIGNLIHSIFAKYAFERLKQPEQPKPFFVYFDEAQYYMNETVERCLTGARKTQVNYTLAHHEFGQTGMSPAAQRTIVNNTNVKIYGSLKWKDMKEGADILGLEDRNRLSKLKAGHFYIKAGRNDVFGKHFPARFSIKKAGFGRGWFINAYAKPHETKAMLKRIIKKQPPPMYEKATDLPIPAKQKPSNFNPHGDMPFSS
ncbi:MAG: helicase HerA domain-containing protein [Terasakiella sp.]|uniref:helicase HerA domain-containing protein n=1 Tax=unclassified Terasakiella TaxID=2614952 RepID=UPI003B002488